jgi:hypothetical protein
MYQARLFAVAAMAALLTACGSGGNQVVPAQSPSNVQPSSHEITTLSTFTARDNATGAILRILPTRDVFSSVRDNGRATMASGNLLYGGGSIQTNPKMYVVFWGSAWNSSSGDPNGVANRLRSFLGVIGGSGWLNSVTQYTQSGGAHVGNASGSFAGWYVDTSTSPPSRPTQSQLAAEATKAAARYGNYTASASYIVALPHGIVPSGFGTQYCAWHSSTGTSRGTIAYTNLPYMPDAGTSCGAGSVNAGGTLDGVTIVGGHEQGEVETDPFPSTGWTDAGGAENGDKCAWTGLINNPNAGGYPTQPLWSNNGSYCAQSY